MKKEDLSRHNNYIAILTGLVLGSTLQEDTQKEIISFLSRLLKV